MAYRLPEAQEAYEQHKKSSIGICNFCNLENDKANEVVSTHDFFYVVKNVFPYASWDLNTVTDHLMLVPKRHIESIGSFTPEEGKEFFKIVQQYEVSGYSLYARSPANITKTIPHQHTHLIKTTG